MLTHNIAGKGGSFMRSFSLAKALVDLGHEVTLLASRRRIGLGLREDNLGGVRVIQMSDFLTEQVRHGGLSPIDLVGRLSHVSGNKYDLIHSFVHRPSASLPALVGRRWKGIPYIADWADLWGRNGIADERGFFASKTLGVVDHYWENYTIMQADYITAITSTLVTRAQALGVPPGRVRLVPVGANIDLIQPMPKAEMRVRYGFPDDAYLLVHTGFVDYDVEMLARMFIVLARRNPKTRLVLTGGEMPRLSHLCHEAGVMDRVHHLGFLPYGQLGEVLACGDVMMLPFSNRPLNLARFPNRLGDYLAAGRPVATNPTGDAGRLVEEHSVGITVPEDPQMFADEVLYLLKNREERMVMGKRARHLAETEYSWRTLAGKLVGFYHQVAGL
jgi:glycosyltransferase involved in cell wall biosynthesis